MSLFDVPAARAGGTVVVDVCGPLGPAEVRQLCNRVQGLLLADGSRSVLCNLGSHPDLGAVDALVRLHLMARRLDVSLRVRATGEGLAALLDLTGLRDVVPEGLEPSGQAETGEQRGVEEVVHVHDPPG
ncbi:MAG: hypothetical protein JWM02_2568 [Frankiales bacterium]|nr:hypothetical protein [Frankiales bacterium]